MKNQGNKDIVQSQITSTFYKYMEKKQNRIIKETHKSKELVVSILSTLSDVIRLFKGARSYNSNTNRTAR